MELCVRVLKESNKSRFDSYSVRNSVLIVSHIAFQDDHMHILYENLFQNSCRWYHLHVSCFTSLLSFYQLPAVYSTLFDAIGAIADECCVCLEKLYHAQGTVPGERGGGGEVLLYINHNILRYGAP